MSTKLIPTKFEQEIIETARQRLGTNLSAFLLSGYGEPAGALCRVFTASRNLANEEIKYQFEMVNTSEIPLPAGRDPAILAALLSLSAAQKNQANKVTFDNALILQMLGWADTPRAHLLIARAIERYFSTAFYLVNTNLPKENLLDGRYSHYTRIFYSYKTVSEQLIGEQTTETNFTVVKLAPELIEGVVTECKYFFNIDFEGLKSFQRVS